MRNFQKIHKNNNIRSLKEFRKSVPVTTYEDYEEFLGEQRDDVLPREPVL